MLATRRGRKPRGPLTQVLPALTFHVMQDAGTLAEHLFQVFRTPLADSSWSDRRLRLPWEIFAELMRRALRPRATPRQHREAFWRGWLLEMGLHNPLAAAVGRKGESEGAVGQRLLAQLPTRALLVGDRVYGVVACAHVAHATCRTVGSHFLLRASRSVKPRLITHLRDGTG
jgi:hypothetical protein